MLVDRVDQSDAGMPLPESNLVGTDRADSGKIPGSEAPPDGHGDGLVHHVSCGLERLGRLGPGQSLGPSGQIPGVRLRQRTLGILRKRPEKAFHPNAAPGTLHSPRCINQHDGNPPEGEIGESSNRLSPMAWTLPSTRTEAGLTVRSSLHKDVDLCLFRIGPLNLLEDEALEFLDVIEDSVNPSFDFK